MSLRIRHKVRNSSAAINRQRDNNDERINRKEQENSVEQRTWGKISKNKTPKYKRKHTWWLVVVAGSIAQQKILKDRSANQWKTNQSKRRRKNRETSGGQQKPKKRCTRRRRDAAFFYSFLSTLFKKGVWGFKEIAKGTRNAERPYSLSLNRTALRMGRVV